MRAVFPEMVAVPIFILAATVAALLLAALVATLITPSLRIWPTPGPGSWQSWVFWPLFRGLNVLCFAVALTHRTPWLGLPLRLRILALLVLIVSVTTFVYAFRILGRDTSYGGRDGLVTDGIYRWSRNPQNAMLVVVYGALAVAADNVPTSLVCGAMMLVYVLMVLLEEPWLGSVYGESYQRYCREVPRFLAWRRMGTVTMSRATSIFQRLRGRKW
jgi:protein-S-isoprenylcysteine O-methyltransferase Ste14